MKLRIDCKSKTGFFVNRDRVHDDYFNDVRRYPVLDEEEQNKLIDTYKNSDDEVEREKAKNKLIESNLRFVISVAKKLGTAETFLDLVSEGNIGLIKAIEKFDPNRNCRFLSYAVSWIIACIKRYQITKGNMVVPPNALKIHDYVKKVTKDFLKENERTPTAHEIADMIREKFNFNISNIDDVELGHVISIEEKIKISDDGDTIGESSIYLSRTCSNNVQNTIDDEYKKHQLDFFLGKLNEREQNIVKRFYGIGCEPETCESIAFDMNIGGERVRQICVAAVEKMKRYRRMVEK